MKGTAFTGAGLPGAVEVCPPGVRHLLYTRNERGAPRQGEETMG